MTVTFCSVFPCQSTFWYTSHTLVGPGWTIDLGVSRGKKHFSIGLHHGPWVTLIWLFKLCRFACRFTGPWELIQHCDSSKLKSDNLQYNTLGCWDDCLIDQAFDVPGPSQQPTVLFPIYKNNNWTIRCLVDETIDPGTQCIILKIVGV